MDSSAWNCCRTCLSLQSLCSIFTNPEHHDKYSDLIFTATGVKIEINDALPQQMCFACINFINNSIKFRRKCEETNMQLLSQLNDKNFYNIVKNEQVFKTEDEKTAYIDISHLIEIDDDFKDYDDNITLNSLQNSQIDIEIPKLDNPTPAKVVTTKKSNKNTKNGEKPKRKLRTKKENGVKDKKTPKSKQERVKEEVECEYCHKILTSRLSLRNHYKIHTGFDVVCEHCGKKFITRRLLLMHCRAKHGYEKTDKCSYCDYRASNAEQVKIHERLHTGERPYVCSACGAGFHRKSSYLQHIAIHLPDKTVQCDQCPARFKSVTLMRIHKNRHRAPAYSFLCRVCENTFARRRNVTRHVQRVHGLTPDHTHIDRRKIG